MVFQSSSNSTQEKLRYTNPATKHRWDISLSLTLFLNILPHSSQVTSPECCFLLWARSRGWVLNIRWQTSHSDGPSVGACSTSMWTLRPPVLRYSLPQRAQMYSRLSWWTKIWCSWTALGVRKVSVHSEHLIMSMDNIQKTSTQRFSITDPD